jgi:hypothetical protein
MNARHQNMNTVPQRMVTVKKVKPTLIESVELLWSKTIAQTVGKIAHNHHGALLCVDHHASFPDLFEVTLLKVQHFFQQSI